MSTESNSTFSKKEYLIGGIRVYVYNSETLQPYIELINAIYRNQPQQHAHLSDIPIRTQYLVHGRGQDYKSTEKVAYSVLEQYQQKNTDNVPLICVTFDVRNHGERIVDEFHNSGWASGNKTHAVDMISCIDGIIDDLKLIIQYLPSYLNLEFFLDEGLARELGATIKHFNILSGISLGGHTVIRFANKYPELVQIINPIVGCSDLSSLLINRLIKTPLDSNDYDKKLFYFNYDELPLTPEQRQFNYPEAFHKYVSLEDQKIWESYPMNEVKLFAAFGANDTLVPGKLSKFWVESYESTNDASVVFVQEDAGHECTPEMIDKFTTWLVKNV